MLAARLTSGSHTAGRPSPSRVPSQLSPHAKPLPAHSQHSTHAKPHNTSREATPCPQSAQHLTPSHARHTGSAAFRAKPLGPPAAQPLSQSAPGLRQRSTSRRATPDSRQRSTSRRAAPGSRQGSISSQVASGLATRLHLGYWQRSRACRAAVGVVRSAGLLVRRASWGPVCRDGSGRSGLPLGYRQWSRARRVAAGLAGALGSW